MSSFSRGFKWKVRALHTPWVLRILGRKHSPRLKGPERCKPILRKQKRCPQKSWRHASVQGVAAIQVYYPPFARFHRLGCLLFPKDPSLTRFGRVPGKPPLIAPCSVVFVAKSGQVFRRCGYRSTTLRLDQNKRRGLEYEVRILGSHSFAHQPEMTSNAILVSGT